MGNGNAGSLQPTLWLTPSPIGKRNQVADSQSRRTVLGDACKVLGQQDSNFSSASSSISTGGNGDSSSKGRQLLSTQGRRGNSNLSTLVASARIQDGGPSFLNSPRQGDAQWENKLAVTAAQGQGKSPKTQWLYVT